MYAGPEQTFQPLRRRRAYPPPGELLDLGNSLQIFAPAAVQDPVGPDNELAVINADARIENPGNLA
jgi:hypothetical protein